MPPSVGGGGSERVRYQVLFSFLQWTRMVASSQYISQDLTAGVGKKFRVPIEEALLVQLSFGFARWPSLRPETQIRPRTWRWSNLGQLLPQWQGLV